MTPSESQVRSTRTPWTVGVSFSRWIGTMGKSCSIAQASGTDWKTLKLVTYLARKAFSRARSSSETTPV